MPTQPSAPARRRWVLPVGALVAVLLVAGGTFAFMSSRQTGTPRAAGSASAVPVAASASATPPADADVCSMLDPNETERLVPQATIDSHTRDNRGDSLVSYVTYSCSWANRNISYKDVTRSREITLDVSKYEAIGTTTAEKSARIQYNGELSFYKYRETISNKKQYYSKAREYQGIGDEAAAQYQWTRDDSWYSFGEGVGRVGDVVFKVKYQASQKKKESDPLSAEGTQSITEENALREVKSLLSQVAKSVAAWRAGKPLPYHARPKPSPTPSPSPTRIPLPP
ncbi:MAG: hypothetical protein IRZ07_31045, partial [Microbispora sp.]|nr:hypothetical protein [Microbispora sp.]